MIPPAVALQPMSIWHLGQEESGLGEGWGGATQLGGSTMGAVCQGREMGRTPSPPGAGPRLPTCRGLLDSAVGQPWFLSHRVGQAPSFSPASVSRRMAARGTELDTVTVP